MSLLVHRSAPRRSGLRVVVAALAGTVLLSGCGSIYELPLPGGAKVGKDPMTVHVEFRDVLDLVPQSTVKVDDVTVGKVTKVRLDGYHADVTMELPRTLDLPDNARAELRQTSLLGEKFVSLSAPAEGAEGRLGNGDTIPLDRTGRNPEVEEVLGALSLLLNGGGVAQLKTIAAELNQAFGGREEETRSLLNQLDSFIGQLDANKADIVRAIEALNRLAIQLKKQTSTIERTLDELPSAIASINRQRADLVKALQGLQQLSDVGVKVIQAAKASTISAVNDLGPVLDKLADAGPAFPKSLQVFLTYPFVNEAVGSNVATANNLHIGDYVNLSVNADIELSLPAVPTLPTGLPTVICTVTATAKNQAKAAAGRAISALPDAVKGLYGAKQLEAIRTEVIDQALDDLDEACNNPASVIRNVPNLLAGILANPTKFLPTLKLKPLKDLLKAANVKLPKTGTPLDGAVDGTLGGLLGGNRAAPGFDTVLNGRPGAVGQLGYNSTLGALLVQGIAPTGGGS